MSYSKNYICKFMQASSWHHKLFHFHLSFWIWKVWKGREKIHKFEYLENERSFLDEIKNIFYSFWRAMIWWKNKRLIKIVDASFKVQNITFVSHGQISLNLVFLLLLVNFVIWFRLELMYISLTVSSRSSLTHFHGFQLLVLLP